MMNILTYLFYPNPAHLTYSSTQIVAILILCAVLIALSFVIKFWRRGVQNAMTKKLSRAWSSISFWFGLSGVVLAVSRVEKIQFIAMRFLWIMWVLLLGVAMFFQWRLFRMRHYEVLPRVKKADARDQYLPGKSKR